MAKTSTYWDKRALKRLTDAERNSDVYINRVKKIYNQAYKDIDKQIQSVYRNYSKATGLDIQKLKELLTKKETDKTWKNLKRQGLDKYIKNNYKSRISRLEQIQAQIYAKAKEIYPKEELQNTMCYKGVINDSYYKAIYDTQIGTKYDFGFNTIDKNMTDALLKERWSGKNYSERIWGNTDILADNVSELLGGALLSGQSIELTSKQLRDRFNTSKYYAERLIRTETNHFHNEADAIAYEEIGIDKYVFVATLDGRTSEICQSMDNKVFDYKDREEGTNFPPLHPNCRSKTRGYLGKEAEKNLQRRARNPITGKTELIDNISYKDWIKQYQYSEKATKSSKKPATTEKKVVKSSKKTTKVVNNNIKNISTDVYNKYKENSFENLALINSKTNKRLGEISNSKSSSHVGYSKNQKILMKDYNRVLYTINNHPSNHTFSLADIYEMFNNDSLCGIIVRTDEYNYYLIPKLEDLDITKNNIEDFQKWFENKLSRTNDMLLSEYPNKSNNELTHMAYKKIFTGMRWKYGREEI